MKNQLKRFWTEEDGMGTVEVVIIVAVLVSVAMIFKTQITQFASKLMKDFFKTENADVSFDGSLVENTPSGSSTHTGGASAGGSGGSGGR